MKKNNTVVELQEVSFIEKHAKKILLVGGVIAAAGIGIVLKQHDIKIKQFTNCFKDVYDITIEQAEVAINKLMLERKELVESIERLDPKLPINMAFNIPERNRQIELIDIAVAGYHKNIYTANTRKKQVM